MEESKLKNLITAIILIGNALLFMLIIFLWIPGGYTSGEFRQLMLITTPLLFAFSAPIVRNVMANRHLRPVSVKVSPASAWIALSVPVIVQVTTAALITLKAYNLGLRTFEDLTIVLAAVQTVFGVYIGVVITEFFPSAATVVNDVSPQSTLDVQDDR